MMRFGDKEIINLKSFFWECYEIDGNNIVMSDVEKDLKVLLGIYIAVT